MGVTTFQGESCHKENPLGRKKFLRVYFGVSSASTWTYMHHLFFQLKSHPLLVNVSNISVPVWRPSIQNL